MTRPSVPSTLRSAAPAARQSGQSSMEYAVVCAALAMALGVGMVDDNSVLKQLLDGFKTAYEKISYALSYPL